MFEDRGRPRLFGVVEPNRMTWGAPVAHDRDP
jgi:hypothetical protein